MSPPGGRTGSHSLALQHTHTQHTQYMHHASHVHVHAHAHAADAHTVQGPLLRVCLRRSLGYALTGNRPVQVVSYDMRSERVSALCALSVFDFEDWRFVTGTYNTERFNEACDDMLRPLLRKFPIVVLDNRP